MNPRIKPIKLKIIAVIFIDILLFFLLVLAGYAFFSIPVRAENVDSPPDASTPNLTFAPKTSIDGTTLLEINNPEGKVFVCKYVGTPGVDERLQTGDNPISVSISAIPDYHGIGSWFADEQGRSYVLVEDVGQPKPPVTDCPQVETPTSTTPPKVAFTPTFTSTPTQTDLPTATPTPTGTDTMPPAPTTTTQPSATSTHILPAPTITPKPSASPTRKPTNTQTSTIQPSWTQSPSITPTSTATSSMEIFSCPSCNIVEDFREMIVSGLYTADLLNTEDISSTIKVSITLFNGYKGEVVGKTIDMVDTQPSNEVMQVQTPLWCIDPITGGAHWIHSVVSAQKSTGERWFVLDEWVRINLTDGMVKVH